MEVYILINDYENWQTRIFEKIICGIFDSVQKAENAREKEEYWYNLDKEEYRKEYKTECPYSCYFSIQKRKLL